MRYRLFLLLFSCLISFSQVAFILRAGGGGGTGGGPPGVLNTSMMLVNDSGSTQAAGTPTPTFGQVFNDGDLCSGAAPVFKISGVVQPFSASPANARTYWNSGCLRFASFMLRPTVSVAGSAQQAVTITGGGSWPSASSRTLTEVYAQNIVANMPASPVGGSAAHSWLLNDSNNYRQVAWLDGDAGKCWRVDTKAAVTQGGTADATIRYDHYVCGLTNSGGSLAGFRWLGSLRQPSFNFAGAPASARVFATPDSVTPTNGVNWQSVGPGVSGTTTTPLTWPFASKAFNVDGGGNGVTTTSNNYYQGNGGPVQVLPVYFTGLSGTSLTPNALYFIGEFQGSTTTFRVSNSGDYVANFPMTGGSGTVNPVVAINPFTRVWFATKDAKYNYFQGTGSIASETTLRTQINQTYWQASKVFPPWDLSVSGSSPTILNPSGGGIVTDTTWPATFDWNPYSLAQSPQDGNATGDLGAYGIVQNNAIVDFYNQSFLSNKMARTASFVAGLLAYDFKDDATGITPKIDHSRSYAGMVDTDARWEGSGTGGGFSQPNTTAIGFGGGFDHKPQYNFWAYATTGELQHLDMLVDMAQSAELFEGGGYRNGSLYTPSYSTDGILSGWVRSTQWREMAWNARELQLAAMLLPFDPTNPTALGPDGTQTALYINNLADRTAAYPIDMINGGGTALYGSNAAAVKATGMWSPSALFNDPLCPGGFFTPPACYFRSGPEFELAFFAFTQAMAAQRGGNNPNAAQINAKKFMSDIMATRWQFMSTNFGFFTLYGYGESLGPQMDCANVGSEVTNAIFTSATDPYAVSPINAWNIAGSGISWTATTPAFQLNGVWNNGWALANGDMIVGWCSARFDPTPQIPTGFTFNTRYFVINLTGTVAGSKFDLTTVKGDASHIVHPSNTGTSYDIMYMPSPTNQIATGSAAYFDEMTPIAHVVANWALALGADNLTGGLASVITDLRFRIPNTAGVCSGSPCGPSGSLYVSPNEGIVLSHPADGEGPVDARYAVQPRFGP